MLEQFAPEGKLELPALPVRGQVLFPSSMMPLTVGRASSKRALEAMDDRQLLAVVAQHDPQEDSPGLSDLYGIGTMARVLGVVGLSKDPESTIAFVKGIARVRIVGLSQREPHLRLQVELLDDIKPAVEDAELIGLRRNIRELFEEIVESAESLPDDLLPVVRSIDDASVLGDFVAASAQLSQQVCQELLETLDVRARLHRLSEELMKEREELRMKNKIQASVAEKFAETQRRFVLEEQLKAIKKELGEGDLATEDIAELRERLQKAELPEEAAKQSERELRRLEHIPEASPEHNIVRTYLDWLATLPWSLSTAEPVELQRAAAILDEDHYDLERVKDRILEFIAVYQLKRDLKGPILCLVGPPGVGKTSLGRSIARATGRKFIRVSLGGMHDEAEIRGHRRTYIGALPGQIVQGLRRAGSRDPVFMLDEVDKVGRDFRGDPAAALLEVLDPEQNSAFVDHYLDVPLDLSRVLFIATANIVEPISPTLRDRMEMIELPGYVDEEKLEIARRYLIPRQARGHGLEFPEQIEFSDGAIERVIRAYTHEAGVRRLEQQIAAICRKRAKQVVGGDEGRLSVTPEVVRELLGVERFKVESELAERTRSPGVAVALAWTPHGGELLFIEVARMPARRGRLVITGQVRDVMQESARAALSWLRARADRYGLAPEAFSDFDLHLHIPSGAVPKDGPSAGIVIATALLSLLRGQPVRPYVAMSGEITLSGRVLGVGGMKEKVLAAKRAGVRELVLPRDNRDEVLEEIPGHLREGLELHFVKTIDQALELAIDHSRAPSSGRRAPSPPRRDQRPNGPAGWAR